MAELIVQENFLPTEEALDVVVSNFGRKLTLFDLIRWKVPSGGSKRFVNNIDEDAEELIALLISAKRGRVYYEKGYDDPDSTPIPDCMSTDGIIGHGNPGGECATCPLNVFMSDCKQRYVVVFLKEHSIIPCYINIPLTSVKSFENKVLLNLTSKGFSYKNHIIKMTLVTASNKNNIKYSKIDFEVLGRVDQDVEQMVMEMVENV